MVGKRKKKVYLVGAGPGDPGLLAVKALRVLREADVVLYDRLVSKAIIREAPKKALKIHVGRGRETAEQRQGRIHRLLLKYHKRGLTVVRLKNGDPLLFGRGGEEMEFLKRHGISYDVVPGISSAIGVPSGASLPLTHRKISSSLLILPGHSMEGKAADWKSAAEFSGTLVVLMGAGNIDAICKKLIEGGKDPMTPACMIRKGSLKDEKIVYGSLEKLGLLAVKEKMRAPVVTVIGDVVRLAGFYQE
jgi:uroporphyrin-III C-methyltransferase